MKMISIKCVRACVWGFRKLRKYSVKMTNIKKLTRLAQLPFYTKSLRKYSMKMT